MGEGFLGKVKNAYAKGIGNERYKEALTEIIFSPNKVNEEIVHKNIIDRDER